MLTDSNHQNTRSYIKTASKDFQLSNSSIKRNLSSLSVYFEYLRSDIQIIKDDVVNPFKGHKLPEVNRKEANKNRRKEFSVGDIRLLEAELRQRSVSNSADDLDKDIYDIFMVAIYTGARREELGQLKVNDYDAVNNTITINEAKTDAGNRIVPLHPKLSLLFSKLNSASGNDYLFQSLTTDQYGKRTDALGKRFGRAKKKLGFDERYVFHSIRKTVATLLERADIPENITCDIVGHEKSATLSYGLYSGGTSLEQKRNAVDKINYSFD
jgi:integrase